MAKARKILRRLRSIRNIHEVTRAMYMISTARFKRAHDLLADARGYLHGMAELAAEAVHAGQQGEAAHPLLATDRGEGILPSRTEGVPPSVASSSSSSSSSSSGERREEETRGQDARDTRGRDARDTRGRDARDTQPPTVLLVIASRRGLCGSYNNAIAERAADREEELRRDGKKVLLRTSGRRGQIILEANGHPVERTYPQFDRSPDPAVVRAIADGLIEEFLRGEIAGAEVAFMRFVSTSQQKPSVERILPLTVGGTSQRSNEVPAPEPVPPIFIPGREEVLRRLIPQAVRARLLECFLEASASEHVARMTAMRYASENADDLIHDLNVRYNRARQGQITMELAEIMGGREGVEGL